MLILTSCGQTNEVDPIAVVKKTEQPSLPEIFDATDDALVSHLVRGNIGALGIYRVVDMSAGIVCYLSYGGANGGIFCFPIEETSLDIGE